MFAVFLTPDYAVFTVSFVVMIGVGLIEALGLGLGQCGFDTDFEHSVDADGIAPGVLD